MGNSTRYKHCLRRQGGLGSADGAGSSVETWEDGAVAWVVLLESAVMLRREGVWFVCWRVPLDRDVKRIRVIVSWVWGRCWLGLWSAAGEQRLFV